MPVSFCAEADRASILWAAILASSMGFIDSSVTSIALPAMRAAFGTVALSASLMAALAALLALLLSRPVR